MQTSECKNKTNLHTHTFGSKVQTWHINSGLFQQPKSETLQAYLNPVLAKLGLWSNQLQVIKA